MFRPLRRQLTNPSDSVALAGAILALARGFAQLDRRDRGVVVACCGAALGINLLFAASWQGMDLGLWL